MTSHVGSTSNASASRACTGFGRLPGPGRSNASSRRIIRSIAAAGSSSGSRPEVTAGAPSITTVPRITAAGRRRTGVEPSGAPSILDIVPAPVYFQQMLGGGEGAVPPVAHFENADLLPTTSFPTVPQGTERNVDWSARYFAQVYIQVAGKLGLHIQLDGPDFASVAVPRDRLRPVESADARLAYGSDDTNYTIPDGGGAAGAAVAAMPVAGYPGETVGSLDILYEVVSPHWEHIRVDLEPPAPRRSRASGSRSAPTMRASDRAITSRS